ncbi:MAG: hypothetical protein Q9218_004519 [Villophora microphyllina]
MAPWTDCSAVHLQARDKVPESTTNVILGCAIGFGVLALVVGLFFIYKAYMRRTERREDHTTPTPFRAKDPRSSTSSRERTPNRGRSQEARKRSEDTQRKYDSRAENNARYDPARNGKARPYIHQKPLRPNYPNGEREIPLQESGPGLRRSRQKETEYAPGHREYVDSAPKAKAAVGGLSRILRIMIEAFSHPDSEMTKSMLVQVNLAQVEDMPHRSGNRIHFHEGHREYRSLVQEITPDGTHDTPKHGFRPNPTSTMRSPRMTSAKGEVEEKVPERVQSSVNYLRDLFPPPVHPREATLTPPVAPMHPTSDASQLISALDAESFHGNSQRQSRAQSPARHSQTLREDDHSITCSMSNNEGYDIESEHRQHWESGHGLAEAESQRHGDGEGYHAHRAEEGSAVPDMMPYEDVSGDFPGLPVNTAREQPPNHTECANPRGLSRKTGGSKRCAEVEPNLFRHSGHIRHTQAPHGLQVRSLLQFKRPHPSNPQQSGFERPETPNSDVSSPAHEPPEFVSRPKDLSDDDEDNYAQQRSGHTPRKKGGYDSRIEQILYEHPDLQIVITDAGKSQESGGSYIVYTIRTGDLEVRRRYSEFHSLRSTLVNLHPTLIIPPIPEKHSMADYAAKPTKAKEDVAIIDLRKRMLTMFLNRCRKMREVREDGVWWRFLDPNASWNEVLHSHPVASIPKSIMKAPPLDPSNPTPAHQWLPVPSTSAKLRSVSRTSSTGTPASPPQQAIMPSAAAHTIPGPQLFGRFPPSSQNLSEQELDPYFNNFESNTRDLELLLQGNIEKVNRRTLTHLSALSTDMAELGARYNGFSLSEQSATVAAAIERIGQAVDSSYIATEELSSSLGANFAEPMRESAQFAGVVRSVLRFRIMKRIQEEMTKDELYNKRNLLESLERSEMEAKRIEHYLSGSSTPGSAPKRSTSSASARSARSETAPTAKREGSNEDADSVDSDFPPTHANGPGSAPTSSQGPPPEEDPSSPMNNHKKSPSGGFVANKIFGRISHAIHGVVDVDPERTRRDTIGKTKESLVQLEQALEISQKDVKDTSAGVLKDLKRFQVEKEDDLKRYMIAYARCHIHWAQRNVETWREAKEETDKIDVR